MAKAKTKTALQSRSNLSFNNYHTTTSDFFQFDVAYCRELVPEQSLTLNLRSQARLAGMPVPSFADVSLNRRAFFVPFRVVWDHWNSFITQQPTYAYQGVQGFPTAVPRFTLKDIIVAFEQSILATPAETSATSYDFMVTYDVSGSTYAKAYNFTDYGRHAYKLLVQLGYNFQFENQGRTLDQLNGVSYSALPLLCATKVYMDWYVPTSYRDFTIHYSRINAILADVKYNLSTTLTYTQLSQILHTVSYVCYGHDYFTDAFDHPTGNNSLNPDLSIIDPIEFSAQDSSYPTHVSVDVDNNTPSQGTPILTTATQRLSSSSNKNKLQITQFGLNALMKLTAFMKRRQIAGSRILENYLAEYGIKLPSVNLDMSVYLTGDSSPVIIRDVTATSQTLNSAGTEGANLGDYAGQGRISPDNVLHVSCDSNGEYGIMIVVTSLIPKIGYVQGVRRSCLHIEPLDFFHGDFDGLGNREIRKDELALRELSDDSITNIQYPYEEVFGFTPQYSEYKVQHDTLSGDFRIGRLARAGFTSDAWHLNRMFIGEDGASYTIPSHGLGFLVPTDRSQYSRIFYVQDSENLTVNADHFVINHIQQCETSAPFKPLYEDYTLEHIDGNNSVSIDVNGNYMN